MLSTREDSLDYFISRTLLALSTIDVTKKEIDNDKKLAQPIISRPFQSRISDVSEQLL